MEETEIRSLVQQIISSAPQLSMADVERAISSATRAVVPPSEISPETLGFSEENLTENSGSSQGQSPTSVVRYPEAFRFTYDPFTEKYKVHNPIVCTPSGQITATDADNLSTGSYYCKVSNKSGTFSAKIVDSSETDEDTVIIIPIADITENDGIHQKHIGAIIVAGSGKEYIAGSDTNIVFTPVQSGANKGKIMVDVYYK